ncbi:MAG TPA: hypothetical protein VK525_17205 [Candidatus Saccharimonadales bacterium]|nr:hypothetical protein [Candidatus Saccharimonadales bacterium]
MVSRHLKSVVLLTLVFTLFFGIYFTWNPSPVRSQEQPAARPGPDHSGMDHSHGHMSASEPLSPDQQAKLLRDKRESEFNHHLAGLLLVLAGIFILFEPRLKRRFPLVRYAWPLCFLVAGILLLIFSDTELWPFGHKDWLVGVIGNLEVLQHKAFAAILMILGVIEFRRARGTLEASWSAWAFPALAFAGSFLLLFHAHDAGMVGPDPMTEMHRIQMQHVSYAGVGAAIGLLKGLSDTSSTARPVFRALWPLLLIFLGILLLLYAE